MVSWTWVAVMVMVFVVVLAWRERNHHLEVAGLCEKMVNDLCDIRDIARATNTSGRDMCEAEVDHLLAETELVQARTAQLKQEVLDHD